MQIPRPYLPTWLGYSCLTPRRFSEPASLVWPSILLHSRWSQCSNFILGPFTCRRFICRIQYGLRLLYPLTKGLGYVPIFPRNSQKGSGGLCWHPAIASNSARWNCDAVSIDWSSSIHEHWWASMHVPVSLWLGYPCQLLFGHIRRNA